VLLTQPLVNLSPDAFNATLYYENGPFKARVSGSYRDAYLIQVAPSATNNNDVRIKEKTFNLDTPGQLRVRQVHGHPGRHQPDRPGRQQGRRLDRMSSEEYVHFGRQFYLGVKYKF
jgi:iron complex outermembrane receptor protein